METLPFWVLSDDEEDAQVKGSLRGDEAVLRHISIDVLRNNLTKLVQSLGTLVSDVRAVGQFKLSEMTFQVEVSASGGIQFIGTTALGGKAAITLKFTGG